MRSAAVAAVGLIARASGWQIHTVQGMSKGGSNPVHWPLDSDASLFSSGTCPARALAAIWFVSQVGMDWMLDVHWVGLPQPQGVCCTHPVANLALGF
jgi:hypothetical protein